MITPLTTIATVGLTESRPATDTTATQQTEQNTAFASLLAALVQPASAGETVEPVKQTALSELEGAQDDGVTDDSGEDVQTRTDAAGAVDSALTRTDDTRPASAEALVAASRAMAATVGASMEPIRTPGALDPEFREKLSRVVSRMRELGHEVRVVETVRSQERQDKLFAQGRTESGPVVTWTRRSRHTEGLAADVTVDGQFGGKGFTVLHRIANEEGLRTLGARDPGHIELPRVRGATATDISSLPPTADNRSVSQIALAPAPAQLPSVSQQPLSHLPSVAQLASVAQVATVARVASVATVASTAGVARVAPTAQKGRAADEAQMLSTTTTRSRNSAVKSADASAALGTMRDLASIAIRRRGEQSEAGEAPSDGSMSRHDALALHLSSGRSSGFGAQLAEAAGLVPTDTSMRFDRVDRVLAAQDAARGRPLHELTMSLDGIDGGTDRIRVGVTGRSVAATIEMNDSASAAQMNNRLEDLTRALERAGLEPEALRIASTESRETMREAAASTARASLNVAEASRTASANAGRQDDTTPRDRDAWMHDDRPRQGGRHRSRQEQQENTK